MIKFPHWFSYLLNEGSHEIGLWGEWIYIYMELPRWLSGKEFSAMQEPQEMWVRSLGQEDPLEEGMAVHFSLLS